MASSMELLECPVCLELFKDPQFLGTCGHSFCRPCIEQLRQARCPTCRKPFTPAGLSPNYALRMVVDAHSECVAADSDEQPTVARTATELAAQCGASPSAPLSEIGAQRSDRPSLVRTALASAADVSQRLVDSSVPFGVAELLAREDQKTALRIFLLDNSGSTAAMDGKYLEYGGGCDLLAVPPRVRSCTRWEEISRMAVDQAKWNVTLGTPCEFVLLNPITTFDTFTEGVDLQLVTPDSGNSEEQIKALETMLNDTEPRGVTPLSDRLRKIRIRILREKDLLARQKQRVVVVVVTDGLPSSTQSAASGQVERNELLHELRRLTLDLPVHLVIRLCTDDDSVVDFYNRIDEEIEVPMEVMDDMQSEAQEVAKAGNRWLVYSPLVHRIREGGCFMKLFDLLDERRLEATEVNVFCQLLLKQADDTQPFPCEPKALVDELCRRLADAPNVFDPVSKKMVPPLRANLLRQAVVPKKGLQKMLPDALSGRSLPEMAMVAFIVLIAALLLKAMQGDTVQHSHGR